MLFLLQICFCFVMRETSLLTLLTFLSLSDNNQTDMMEVSNSTSRYLDDFNIDNPYFEQMVGQITN